MRLITVKLEKIKSNFYAKIPSIIADSLHLKKNEEIEISIHSEPMFAQGSFWDEPVHDIDSISLDLSKDIHTVNKYNKIQWNHDNTVGPKSISKQEYIIELNKLF